MQSPAPTLLSRDDTFFGVCEALGEDFGFDPLWLRLALALGVFWSPSALVVGYAAVGLAVALSRLLYPAAPVVADAWRSGQSAEVVGSGNDLEPCPTALAA